MNCFYATISEGITFLRVRTSERERPFIFETLVAKDFPASSPYLFMYLNDRGCIKRSPIHYSADRGGYESVRWIFRTIRCKREDYDLILVRNQYNQVIETLSSEPGRLGFLSRMGRKMKWQVGLGVGGVWKVGTLYSARHIGLLL